MADLKGKVAFVTGGSRGMGAAIVKAMALSGAQVGFVFLHREDLAASLVESLGSRGAKIKGFQADVCDRERIRFVLREIEQAWGGVDILVNNAGINQPADFDQISDEEWDRIMATNLKGPFICAQEVLPLMRKRGGGAIINISSVSGQYGGPRTAHYAASKAGLISLGQVIARFGAPDRIRCNTLAAGFVDTEMASTGMLNPTVQAMADKVLLGRLGTPEEIADAAVFLASDESRYITAQTLNVNGGLYF